MREVRDERLQVVNDVGDRPRRFDSGASARFVASGAWFAEVISKCCRGARESLVICMAVQGISVLQTQRGSQRHFAGAETTVLKERKGNR